MFSSVHASSDHGEKEMGITHIENERLFGLASGQNRFEEWESDHLHACEVCQGVLYFLLENLQPALFKIAANNDAPR